MDPKTPSSATKTTFFIRSPLSIFTFRGKPKDNTPKSARAQGDVVVQPDSIKSHNKKRPKKKDSKILIPLSNETKEGSKQNFKPLSPNPSCRKSEDLSPNRFQTSILSRTKEKMHSMPGLDEKALEGLLKKLEQNKKSEVSTPRRGLVSRVSSFFGKFKISQTSTSPKSIEKSSEPKKPAKRVTFAINILEAESHESRGDLISNEILRKRRGTARPDAELLPIYSKFNRNQLLDSLSAIPVDSNILKNGISPKESNVDSGLQTSEIDHSQNTPRNDDEMDLEIDLKAFEAINSSLKVSSRSTAICSSLSSKGNFLTPLNLGNTLSRTPSDHSLSPAKDKYGLSPINLLPIKTSLMYDNKSRSNSCFGSNAATERENFLEETEPARGSITQRNINLNYTKGQTFNQRVNEVKANLKLPSLIPQKRS